MALVFGGIVPPAYKRGFDPSAYQPPSPVFRIVDFNALPGWHSDDIVDAFPAFLHSCEKIKTRAEDAPFNSQENLGDAFEGFSLAGRVAEWKQACDMAHAIDPGQYASEAAFEAAIRIFFQNEFQPVQILSARAPKSDGPARGRAVQLEETGVFTGYFEPIYEAGKEKSERFPVPILARPDDLIDVNLGSFRDNLAGSRISGRVEGSRLVPYWGRREINEGALEGKTEVLAWMDPDDLFFLQIQGSGQLLFDDGTRIRAGYAGGNGRAYTAIGRILVQSGEMALADASMASIRSWLDRASEEDARALREANVSYIFFRELGAPPEGLGPPGAQGVNLTPERSLAVDRRFHALGMPVFVDIEETPQTLTPIRKLMIAQDTGGAIRGPVRGDFFWGAGPAAGDFAGAMNAQGRMFVLLPRARVDALDAYQRAQ